MTETWCEKCIELLDYEPEILTIGGINITPCIACGKLAGPDVKTYTLRSDTLKRYLRKIADKTKIQPLPVYFVLIGNRRFICPDSRIPNPISLDPCEVLPLQGDVWKENYSEDKKK